MHFWMPLWTAIWFGGLAIFGVLSVLVTIYGARDIVTLLRTLKDQHEEKERQ